MTDDDWQPSCWDCEREMARRDLQPHPVHIDHDDEPGYDRVEVPMCGPCRRNRMVTHDCPRCGREYVHPDRAAECCQHLRGEPHV